MEQINIDGTGFPRVVTAIIEQSPSRVQPITARVGVVGITTMGAPYMPIAINSWSEFVMEFGGLHPYSQFPLLCKRALESGGQLYVVRAAHEVNGDWEGTKASATVTQGGNNLILYAREVGEGYNGITVRVKAAKSRDATKVDVEETYNGKSNIVYDINLTTPAVSDAIKLANGLKYVRVNTLPATMPIGTATLSGGSQTGVVEADIIGSPTAMAKGLHAFDETYDFGRIANFEYNNPIVDAAFIAYCELRQDMRAALVVPDNAATSGDDMVAYRRGSGSYNHPAFDTLYADMYVGVLKVPDATAVGGVANVSCIGDVVGRLSAKDRTSGHASSVGGATRGIISALDVAYNLEGPTKREEADFVYNNGLNPVVRKSLPNGAGISSMQIVIWGNRSLKLDQTSGFRYSNVCDLMVLLRRLIHPVLNTFVFEPNQPSSWHRIYARVKPIIEGLVAQGFIQAGENDGWRWDGDQHAKTLQDAQVNLPADISNGNYRANLFVKPVGLIEYIGFTLTRTDNETTLEITQ